MKKVNTKLIFNILVFAMSIGLMLYFCLSPNGLADLLKSTIGFKFEWFIFGFLCQIINIAIDCFLIHLFLKGSKCKISIKNCIKAGMVGQFFSAITPSSTGGQPMQIYFLSKQNVNAGSSASAFMQKFIVYQSCTVLYSIFAIFVCSDFFKSILNPVVWQISIVGFLAQVLVIVLLAIFSFSKKITNKIIFSSVNLLAKVKIIKHPDDIIDKIQKQLSLFHDSNLDLYKNKSLLVKTCLLTIAQLTAIFSIPYCIYRGFNLSGDNLLTMICAQAFVTMTASLVPIPGASGASEGSFYIFFRTFFTNNTLKSATIIWRSFSYYFTILISAPFSMLTKNKENV